MTVPTNEDAPKVWTPGCMPIEVAAPLLSLIHI